ncbi:hypothetical protein BC941DRAFT_164404 [Chlamydoabsidia padenii]|nr:hypothetical protein BC941DRAFT_164404 [Chlamydoabsidia padenii]
MTIKRIKPCDNCKKKRRKCERPPDKANCLRCTRLKRDCIYDDSITKTNNQSSSATVDYFEEMAEIDGSKELQKLMCNVRTLEQELAQLEGKLDQGRQLAMINDTTHLPPIPKKWNLSIVNGHLRLETGIHTLGDLLQYRQTTLPIRYLSPFNSNNQTPFQFKLQQGGLLTRTVQLLTKHDLLSGNTSNHTPWIPPIDSELLVDRLVRQHFQCYNTAFPLLHELTFMTRYNNNKSTRHSALTLAICCFMCVSYCTHIPFTAYDKRAYGEYFYLACREQLDDLLDDPCPHRQLDALMAIHFLLKFMTLTLKLKEVRRMTAYGFLISVELAKRVQVLDQVEKEMANRHRIMAAIVFTLTEFVCVQRMDDILPTRIELVGLPGESAKAVGMLKMYNCLFNLALHHDCIVMVEQLRRVSIGQVGQLNLETIVRFDQVCLDWWKNLPWRYCDNPYDDSARWAIEHSDDDIALVAHSFILTLTLGVHSTLLHPQNLHNDQLSDSIQKKAMMMILNCCELMQVVAARLRVVSDHCGFECDCLLRVFDSLQSLLVHSRKTNNNRAVATVVGHINRCLTELDAGVLSELGKLKDPSGLVYANYPLPGNALVFDLISTSAKSIGVDMP